jgi:hypothetical protein
MSRCWIAANHSQLPDAAPSPPASLQICLEDDRGSLVRTVQEAIRQRNHALGRSVFENLEVLLVSRDPQLRGWAIEFLEALQDSAAWDPQQANAYTPLMGPGARRIWFALDAIRSDLAECSVLEAEVGMWRVVHHG